MTKPPVSLAHCIFEWSTEGQPLLHGREPRLAPGVRGCAFNTPDGVYIPLVIADNPGNGDVSRWLDTLPDTVRIVFPNIINPLLKSMLIKRNFRFSYVRNADLDQAIPALVRGPSKTTESP